MAWSWPTILRRRELSNSRASLLRRVGSRTVARFVLIGSTIFFLSGNCRLPGKLDILHRLAWGERQIYVLPHPYSEQTASHLPKTPYSSLPERFRCG